MCTISRNKFKRIYLENKKLFVDYLLSAWKNKSTFISEIFLLKRHFWGKMLTGKHCWNQQIILSWKNILPTTSIPVAKKDE